MLIIADTNIWYNISKEKIDVSSLKKRGTLSIIPTSILEIISLININNFKERKKVAETIIKCNPKIMIDTEIYLAQLWGFNIKDPKINWIESIKALSQANSIDELKKGVYDCDSKVIRKVNIKYSKNWRTFHWDDFKNKIIDVINIFLPGYKEARKKGGMIHFNKEDKIKFIKVINSPPVRNIVIKASYQRALLTVGRNPDEELPIEKCLNTEPLISNYINAYIEYLIDCATNKAPNKNDLGDIEYFYYLQNNTSLATKDNRWEKIAKKVCPNNFINLDTL